MVLLCCTPECAETDDDVFPRVAAPGERRRHVPAEADLPVAPDGPTEASPDTPVGASTVVWHSPMRALGNERLWSRPPLQPTD